jgi:hypothetical protein
VIALLSVSRYLVSVGKTDNATRLAVTAEQCVREPATASERRAE